MSKKKISLILSGVLVLYYYSTSLFSQQSVLSIQNKSAIPTQTLTPIPITSTLFMVTKVVDGDTIKVTDTTTTKTVRLIGVDTPEIVDPREAIQCFGQEASNFTKSLLDGKKVKLQTDSTQQTMDKYGRLLAYVYLEDGTLVNEKIIRSGFGYEYTYAVPYRYQKQFKDAQSQAEREKVGLWNSRTCGGNR